MKIFFTISLVTLMAFSAQAGRTIEVRADEWCPYTCEPGTGQDGIILEIAKKIFEPKGYKISYKLMNWARSIKETRKGKFDAIAGAGRTDAPDFKFPKNFYSWQKVAFFAKADSSLKIESAKDFVGKKLGVINSYTYDDGTNAAIEKKEKYIEVVSGDDGLSSLTRLVEQGRIDAFVENPAVFKFFTKKNKIKAEKFKIVGKPKMEPQELFIAFGPKVKDADELNKIFDEGIAELRKSGELKKITEKYGLEE